MATYEVYSREYMYISLSMTVFKAMQCSVQKIASFSVYVNSQVLWRTASLRSAPQATHVRTGLYCCR
jgi:hypothetical protein